MKPKLIALMVLLFGGVVTTYAQLDTYMMNQWLNQMNTDMYIQQQKMVQDLQKLVESESKRQEENAMASCNLVISNNDKFFAHIYLAYIVPEKIEILYTTPDDAWESELPSSSYFYANGQIVTTAFFGPGYTVIIRRKDTGKILCEKTIPSKRSAAYRTFVQNSLLLEQRMSNNGNYYSVPENNEIVEDSYINTRPSKKCSLCYGKGWIVGANAPDYTGGTFWCDECDREVNVTHTHERCPSCNGTGKTY